MHYFISRLCRRMRKSITNIPGDIMDALISWDWPGNIRELENFIERAVILSQGSSLNAPLAELASPNVRLAPAVSFRDSERNAIISALKSAKGKVSGKEGAAERLGLKRPTLLNKCEDSASLQTSFASNMSYGAGWHPLSLRAEIDTCHRHELSPAVYS